MKNLCESNQRGPCGILTIVLFDLFSFFFSLIRSFLIPILSFAKSIGFTSDGECNCSETSMV